MSYTSSSRPPALCPNFDCQIEQSLDARTCPKCDEPLPVGLRDAVFEIDVAHSRETWTEALDKIEQALASARAQRFRGVRVIHGVGRNGSGSDWEGPGRIRRESVNYLQQAAVDVNATLEQDPRNRGATLFLF